MLRPRVPFQGKRGSESRGTSPRPTPAPAARADAEDLPDTPLDTDATVEEITSLEHHAEARAGARRWADRNSGAILESIREGFRAWDFGAGIPIITDRIDELVRAGEIKAVRIGDTLGKEPLGLTPEQLAKIKSPEDVDWVPVEPAKGKKPKGKTERTSFFSESGEWGWSIYIDRKTQPAWQGSERTADAVSYHGSIELDGPRGARIEQETGSAGDFQTALESANRHFEYLLDDFILTHRNTPDSRGVVYTPEYHDPDGPLGTEKARAEAAERAAEDEKIDTRWKARLERDRLPGKHINQQTKMLYYTGVDTDSLALRSVRAGDVGLLLTPRVRGHLKHADDYSHIAIDNGAFAKGGFDEAAFLRMLDDVQEVKRPFEVDFVVAPDVVGDAAATLELAKRWLPELRSRGFRPAFVLQDGIEEMPEAIPWDDFDVLFIGGSTDFKLGLNPGEYSHGMSAQRWSDAAIEGIPADRPGSLAPDNSGLLQILQEAKDRGIPVHMGRVNSKTRLDIGAALGVASADGTGVGIHPFENAEKVGSWLNDINGPDAPPGSDHWINRKGHMAGKAGYLKARQGKAPAPIVSKETEEIIDEVNAPDEDDWADAMDEATEAEELAGIDEYQGRTIVHERTPEPEREPALEAPEIPEYAPPEPVDPASLPRLAWRRGEMKWTGSQLGQETRVELGRSGDEVVELVYNRWPASEYNPKGAKSYRYEILLRTPGQRPRIIQEQSFSPVSGNNSIDKVIERARWAVESLQRAQPAVTKPPKVARTRPAKDTPAPLPGAVNPVAGTGSFKRGAYRVAQENGASEFSRTGWVYGHFGVEILDPATAPKGPKFVTITHLPTGLGMPKMVSPSDAKEIARTFEHFAAERGIDLDITTPPKNSQPMRELFDDILEGRVEMPKKDKAPPTMKTWSGERQIYKEQAEAALKELESTGDIDFERDFDMALSRERDRIGKEVEAAKRTERDEADAASRAGQPPPKVKAPNEWYAVREKLATEAAERLKKEMNYDARMEPIVIKTPDGEFRIKRTREALRRFIEILGSS